MACPVPRSAPTTGAAPTRRSASGHEITLITDASPAAEDFEFCVLSSGGLASLAGQDAADMCAADEVFSGGKLLPLRLCSATSGDSSALLLLRSDSLDGATSTAASTSGGFSSRSSSSSSSCCVSRSTSSKSSASSNPASLRSLSNKSASSLDATKQPPRRPPSSSVFYAHPSPSPRPPRRSAASAARRSTGSAPPASWGLIRLGVVAAPEVYPRRAPAAARGGSQSARFEQASAGATKEAVHPVDRRLGLGLLGAGLLVCSCSPYAVAPVGTAEAAAAEARRRRKKADDKKKPGKQSGQSSSSRSRRILDWLEELSMPGTNKNVA